MSERVPEGWRINSIAECCEILDSQRIPLNSEERSKRLGEYPYYGANGIQGYVDDFIFDGDAILVAEDGGNFDQYAERPIAQWVTGKYWVNNHAHILRAKENDLDKWVFYSLVHKNILKFINGGTRAKLNQSDLREIQIYLPPLPEQKKIASILTSVDEVIETTQKQIDKLQDLKKATMNELLTKGIGHTEFKDSELGRIPKSWEVRTLGDFSEFRNGLNFSQKNQGVGLKIVGVGDFKNYEHPKYSNLSEINPDGIIREDDYLKENDFIFVRSNGNRNLIGRSLYIKNIGAKKVSYSGFVIRCRIDFSKEITPDFCNCIFKSSLFKKKIYDAGAGTNISNLSQELLSEIFLQFPPVEEQDKISKTLNSISKRIANWETKLSQTQSLKKSLMQDLLTGKVRVQVN